MKTLKRFVVVFVTAVLVCVLAPAPRTILAQDENKGADYLLVMDDTTTNEGTEGDGTGNQGGNTEGQDDPDPDDLDNPALDVCEVYPTDSASQNKINIQYALDQAANYTGEGQFRVVLKGGLFEIDQGIRIKSNTHLVLNDDAIIKRSASSNGNSLFNIGYEDSVNNNYDTVTNVTISGGILDNAYDKHGKVLHFEQCNNIVMENVTFRRSRTDHVIIFDGVKDAQVLECTFTDCISDGSHHADRRYVNEAIHIDSTMGKAKNDNEGHEDGLPCRGITVDSCTFDGVCCAAGAHFHGDGDPMDPMQYDITMTNNIVKKVDGSGTPFTAANVRGWTLAGNTFAGTGAEHFLRLNGCKDYTIANNTVSNVKTFAEDNGAATDLTSNGTLSGNKVTGITGPAFRTTNIASNHTLSGENYTTVKKNPTTTSVDDTFIYAKGATMTVKGCTFTSPESGYTASTAYIGTIKFDGGKLTFQDNKVYNTPYAGLYLINLTSAKVTGNTLGYCARVTSNNGNNSYTLILDKCTSCTVTDNTLKSCKRGGIYLNGSQGNNVSNNTIAAAKDRGIYLYNSSSNTIQGNTVETASDTGIHLSSSNKNTVKNNVIKAAASAAGDVVQYNSSGNTLSNNGPTFSGATRIPVRATAAYTISGGTLSSSNTGVISVSGKTLTAKKAGSATITLTYNGRTYTKEVTVYAIHGKKYEMQSSVDSNYVLDIQKGSTQNGAQMIVYERNGGKNQQYQFYLQGDNTYCIRSVKSQKWLNVESKTNKYVIQWSWTGGANTKWNISVDSSNRVTFISKASGKSFDVQGGKTKNGAKMIVYTSKDSLNQKWVLNQK